ncbi:hypothetical protein B0T26DRAFT_801390 [Lasiosphaeria miniovina]|uniref:Uncharacterized protein n=1 Tax=Lasiosphaeria miniovina TaxID=1954250 RepID=A0AA40DZU8_9PEZI|nr:uncharacterized protein B0T26DRAFT_801390 [Lasiosphaeria miniovina]KAK0722674.1 hypothetical protein B0T26DRAFT_801390 [Lasiosphaeria miniovina]
MRLQNFPPSSANRCPSDTRHSEGAITSPVHHYFGCLRETDRRKYYETLDPRQKAAIRDECRRIITLRRRLDLEEDSLDDLPEVVALLARRHSTRADDAGPSQGENGSDLQRACLCGQCNDTELADDGRAEKASLEDGVLAHVVEFRRADAGRGGLAPHTDNSLRGVWPDQTAPVSWLLAGDTRNPLRSECPEDGLRWLHLPYNNLAWMEQIVGSDSPSGTFFHRSMNRAKQEDGALRSWHMRAMCESELATDTDPRRPSQPNIALYMPYLSWEYERQHLDMSAWTQEAQKLKQDSMSPREYSSHPNPHLSNQHPNTPPFTSDVHHKDKPHLRLRSTLAAWRQTRNRPDLAVALAAAAHTAQALRLQHDRAILAPGNNAVEPRRTLHQAAHWTVDTQLLDRGQVTRQATVPVMEYAGDTYDIRWRWSAGTPHTRLLMVDSVWLFVAGAGTLVTCFPARYGERAGDGDGGLHGAVRRRLAREMKDLPGTATARDLALLVLDECAGVFFGGRAAAPHAQPPVLDIFGRKISDVTRRCHLLTEQIETFTRLLAALFHSGRVAEASAAFPQMAGKIKMQKDMKGVLGELRIMRCVLEQQVRVVGIFRHAEHAGDDDDHLCRVGHHLAVVENLIKAAEDAQQELDDLTSTMAHLQQEASVVRSFESAWQGEETAKQGKALMLFTIVTVIFSPLSFMSSIFSMNSVELSQSPLSLGDEVKFMVLVSAAVIAVFFTFAYSSTARAAGKALFSVPCRWVATHVGPLRRRYMARRAPSASSLQDRIADYEAWQREKLRLRSRYGRARYESMKDAQRGAAQSRRAVLELA